MKRVLIFSTAYLPLVGGAEVAIKEITDRLGPSRRQGNFFHSPTFSPTFKFDLITAKLRPGLPREEQIGNVNVHRIGWGSRFDKFLLTLFGIFMIRLATAGQNIDIGWVVMASWNAAPALFLKILRPKIKLVLTLQEGDPIEGRRFGLVSLVWRLVLKYADVVTVISNYLGDLARKYGYGGTIELVPNAVDLVNFSRDFSPAELEGLKRRLGKNKGDIFLITASRLVEKNAVGDIIEALKFLPENVKLLIAGTGPLELALKSQITNSKLQTRVKMLGYVIHEELPKYLRASDIFVRPSLSEGLGNSFLEAMAVGLPIIGTPVGGVVDFLKDRETGLFCEVGNPKSIAEKVKLLISDSELRNRLIKNGKQLVFEKYDWQKIATKMRSIFDKLT